MFAPWRLQILKTRNKIYISIIRKLMDYSFAKYKVVMQDLLYVTKPLFLEVVCDAVLIKL
jgi:hypothetical protein